MRQRILNFWSIFALTLLLVIGGAVGYSQLAPSNADAYAGAEVVGNPDTGNLRAILAPAGGQAKKIIYFDGVVRPTGGTTTPVVGRETCGFGDYTLYRLDVNITGTMTGSSPTLGIKWQQSIGGTGTWKDVGTWTSISTTSITTPANVAQSQTVSDIYNAATSVAYGDCWRPVLTFGGTGAVGVNIEIAQIAK